MDKEGIIVFHQSKMMLNHQNFEISQDLRSESTAECGQLKFYKISWLTSLSIRRGQHKQYALTLKDSGTL